MSDSRIGQLLVHDKFIDRDQLDQAIQAAKSGKWSEIHLNYSQQ